MSKSWYDYYQFIRVASTDQNVSCDGAQTSIEMMPYDNGPSNAVSDAMDYSKDHPAEYVYLYQWTLRKGIKLVALVRDGKPDLGLACIFSEVDTHVTKAMMPLISTYLATMVRASEGDAAEVKGDAIP